MTGTGTVYFESDVTPGFSPAAISFGGDIALSPTARLVMEIGGLTPGTQHDQANVAGVAALDGTMVVTPYNGFRILPGDLFTLLTFASHTGDVSLSFANNPYAGLGIEKIYSATALVVRATGLPGDADLNGVADFDDLLVLAKNYNHAGTNWLTADFDRSGTTDFNDLLALAKNYNHGFVPAATLAELGSAFTDDWRLAQSMVPEPTGLGLLIFGATLAKRSPRRCRDASAS